MQRTRAHGHPATSLHRGERERKEQVSRKRKRKAIDGSQRSEEASELSGTFRGFATTYTHTREGRTVLSLSPQNIVFVSYRDFTAMPRCHHPVTQHPVCAFQRAFILSLSFSRPFWYGYIKLKGARGGCARASLRQCCCASVAPPFHRNQSKTRCPSVCLIEI